MWMHIRWKQRHQVNHVDDSDTQTGCVVSQPPCRCDGFERWHVAGGCQDYVWVAATGSACPVPGRSAECAVFGGTLDIKPLQLRLLVNDDQVDIVPAAQTVIGDRQQAV